MRRLTLTILFFLWAACSWATLAEKYVTATASGGGDGSIGSPWTLAEARAAQAAGDRINVLTGAYSLSGDQIWGSGRDGTAGSPIIYRAVSSHSPLTPLSPTRASIGDSLSTQNMPVITYTSGSEDAPSCKYTIFENLRFVGNRASGFFVCNAGPNIYRNLVIENTYTGGSGSVVSSANSTVGGSIFENCDFIMSGVSNSAYVVSCPSGNWIRFIRCRAVNRSNSCAGGFSVLAGASFNYCTIGASSGVGIYFTSANAYSSVINCSIYGQGVAGIQTPNAVSGYPLQITNNIFSGNAMPLKNLYVATGSHQVELSNNAYYSNTSPSSGFGDWPEQGRIDLASDPFVSASTGDFRLKPGSLARNAGLGGVDCGAIQHSDPTQPTSATVVSGTVYNDGLTTGSYIAPAGRRRPWIFGN